MAPNLRDELTSPEAPQDAALRLHGVEQTISGRARAAYHQAMTRADQLLYVLTTPTGTRLNALVRPGDAPEDVQVWRSPDVPVCSQRFEAQVSRLPGEAAFRRMALMEAGRLWGVARSETLTELLLLLIRP